MNAKTNKALGLCAITFAMVAANFVNGHPTSSNSAMQMHHVKLIYIGHAPANKAG